MIINKIIPADYYRVRLKAKDLDNFFVSGFYAFCEKQPIGVLQNPIYPNFADHVQGLKYADWSVQNLRNKGYNIKSRPGFEPSQELSFYFLCSDKIINSFMRKFGAKADKSNSYTIYDFRYNDKPNKKFFQRAYDSVVSKISYSHDKIMRKIAYQKTMSFCKTVEPSMEDIFYRSEVVYLLNALHNNNVQGRFNKLLNRYKAVDLSFDPETFQLFKTKA